MGMAIKKVINREIKRKKCLFIGYLEGYIKKTMSYCVVMVGKNENQERSFKRDFLHNMTSF